MLITGKDKDLYVWYVGIAPVSMLFPTITISIDYITGVLELLLVKAGHHPCSLCRTTQTSSSTTWVVLQKSRHVIHHVLGNTKGSNCKGLGKLIAIEK